MSTLTAAADQITSSSGEEASSSTTTHIPAYVLASVFSSVCIIVGLIWDISWHTSIGRDGLLSPQHISIYLGAVTAGIFSGFKVLKITIAGSPEEKASTVKFWGVFRGSLGALFCIWGAIAMLTSAPFDDWWHNTYGLDVTILSPPHTVLALGMMMIQFGAMISALSLQNRLAPGDKALGKLKLLFVIASGILLVSLFTLGSEFFGRHDMHHSLFYQVAAFIFPLYLIAVAKSSKLEWAATATALVYSLVLALMVWILPLFEAEPLLGPIRNHITHYQAFEFPLLLIVPAFFIDLLLNRFDTMNSWLRSLLLALVFVLSFVLVQWPFGDFLMSEYGRGAIFGQSSWYFGSSPDWEYRFAFTPWHTHSGIELIKGLAIACGIAFLSARIGIAWGNWMEKVQR
jgi:hypothetical protein